MLENKSLCIIGRKVVLVPYEKEHVDKYHQWMTDPYLQEMTASEPLSIEEEYEMQISWRKDPKKCTFIVLAKEKDIKEEDSFKDEDAIRRMAGDVNLFFNDDEDEFNCEVDIMIAESKYRRQGFAEEAVRLVMAYAISKLNVKRFYCKINESNEPSLKLFRKLGFQQCNYVAAFQEYELELFTEQKKIELSDQVFSWATLHQFVLDF